jgi:hypothetical protein
MERKIRGTEAKAAAMVEMGDESFDTQFSELDYDADVEAELAALKGESPAPAALGDGGDNATANQTAGTSTAATGSGS